MAPKPKIPPEYVKVAKRLSSEVGDDVSKAFDEGLDDLARGLSDNLDSRSVDLPNTETYGKNGWPRGSTDTVKEAGIFTKSYEGKTPDVKSAADFEVSMDELLSQYKEPKAVEGSGVIKSMSQKSVDGTREFPIEIPPIDSPESASGVVWQDYTPAGSLRSSEYTPGKLKNEAINLLQAGAAQPRRNATRDAQAANEVTSEELYPNGWQGGEGQLTEFTKPAYINHANNFENIPAVVGGIVGAGVLLSSQNANASEFTPDKELEVDTGAIGLPPKISLTSKVNARQGISPDSVTQEGNSSTIMDEIDNLAARAKHNLGSFAKDAVSTYTQFQSEKDALNIRANEMINNMEANGQTFTEDEKALLKAELGLTAGSPLVSAASEVEGVIADVSKFNHEVIQPIKHTIRAFHRIAGEPVRDALYNHAPSLAVLHDTVAYPLLGTTGWNVSPDKVGITDTEEDMEKGMSQLDPEVRKLFDDKTALLGTDAGKAMFVFANKFADLPLWVLGGTGKAAMMFAGAANEAVSDDPEADLTRGATLGLAGGKVMEAVIAPVAKKAISLIGKVKLDPSTAIDMFGKVTFDDNATHIKKVWEAFVNKVSIDPLLMTTGKGATMMADNAMLKVRPDVSQAMNDKTITGIKPQALVLSIDAATGKPRVFGVKNGLYGELNEHVNPEGRPVLINQIAKDEWMENEALRDVWNKLIDPKRKTPNTRAAGIDEWTPDVIPPENPALVLAWKQFANGEGGAELYRAGSREFARDFLKARVPVRVEFTGPDGRPDTGIGFWGAGGNVIFAPDPSENIPGAILKDLTFKQTRINPNVQPTKPLPPQNMAWEINHLTDEDMYHLVDDMRARNDLNRMATEEAARGALDDGVTLPDRRPPAPFDNLPDQPGSSVIPNKNVTDVNFSFLPIKLQDMAKAVQKMSHSVNNAAGRLKLISDTVYGEKFKIDASIIAFSLRHYKRLVNDLNTQLIDSFKDAASTPLQREQFNNQLRYFIENHQVNNPAPLPPQLQPAIQQKVQKFVAERNYEYALIEQLGGTVPDKSATGNAELERLFALDYFREGGVNYEREGAWSQFYNKVTGHKSTDNQWLERMRKQQPQTDGIINLLQNKEASKVSKTTRAYDQVMGRMSTEMEMATDYMNRKLKLNQLAFMKELADNTQASSPVANQMLGHTKQVTFNDAGMLKGKFVSAETYNAIHTYPKDQVMLQNTMLGVVNMIKFNKTVLNPTTWVKNIMGNVWGVMNSNIVPSWRMFDRMPHGINVMRKDLAKFNADVMANDSSVHRVHETLKYGLLGNEFESSRTAMLDVLDNLAEPIARTSNRTWGEKIAHGYFKAKDNTLGAMAHVYSKVDMATKYSLYVNGLERWGIDLATNKLHQGSLGRKMAADLLGATTAHNWQIDEETLTDMIKREIVRRIHLSLPMVDRIGPIATTLNKASPITNPWLRTASELTRITLQMPHRMATEKGYFVNSLKTASFLGTILGVNKALRLREGISDESVDDAKRIAPKNITNYMPGATATRFYAGEGKERGLVYVDMANGLIEPAQWFKGGEINDGTQMAKRIGANGIDLIMGGGLLSDESREAQAALGLTDSPQNYGVPFWKQNDAQRYAIQKAMSAGPAVFNNAWQLYATQQMPDSKGVRGKDKLEQPLSMQMLKAIGIPVATMGTQKQKEYKLAELQNRRIDLLKKKAYSGLQTEGSSTGAFQEPYNEKDVKAKHEAEIKRLDEEIKALRGSKPIGKNKDDKIDLLNVKTFTTPHL